MSTIEDVIKGRAKWCVVEGERDEVLAQLGDATVDVTITDPPYNERTHKGAKARGGKLESDTTVRFAEIARARLQHAAPTRERLATMATAPVRVETPDFGPLFGGSR